MKKLFKLRQWLTLDEAAKYLSLSLTDDVQVKDVCRLALDGYLRISVNFINNAYALTGKVISAQEVEWRKYENSLDPDFAKDEGLVITESLRIDDERYVHFDEGIKRIDGVWDLMMVGSEKLEIEHQFQLLSGGPNVSLINLEGAFVERDGVVCQIHEAFDKNQTGSTPSISRESHNHKIRDKRNMLSRYYPSDLPDDCAFVVRCSEINEFLETIKVIGEKTLKARERNSLLVIIAALCEHAGLDYSERGAPGKIERLTDRIGAHLSDDTIRNVISQIENALDSRSS